MSDAVAVSEKEPRFDQPGMLGAAWRWGAVFAVLTLAGLALHNLQALAHIGWYLQHRQVPADFTWPSALTQCLSWLVAGALTFAWRGRDGAAARATAWGGVLWGGVLWGGLALGIVAAYLASANQGALRHLGWYLQHMQIPAELHGISGGMLLLFVGYAWLIAVLIVSPLTIKRPLLALLFVMLLGLVFHADGSFFKWDTHRDMLRHISRHGILACGMTLVIITGGIDLAVGSVLGLVAVVSAILSIHWGLSPWVAVPLCLAVGTACGGASGTLVARYRMQPFIATLAMMVFARGLAKFVSGGAKISRSVQYDDGGFAFLEMPGLYDTLNARILGDNVAVVTLIFLACVGLSWLVLARFRLGRYLYAVGGNEEAAALSGVSVARVKVLAYGMSGLFAAVAGICQAAQETQGDPNAGMAYELTAIAIVVIGGTNLMGGRGGIFLTLLGTLTIGYLEKILSINAVEEAQRLMLTGAIIVTAVLMQREKR